LPHREDARQFREEISQPKQESHWLQLYTKFCALEEIFVN